MYPSHPLLTWVSTSCNLDRRWVILTKTKQGHGKQLNNLIMGSDMILSKKSSLKFTPYKMTVYIKMFIHLILWKIKFLVMWTTYRYHINENTTKILQGERYPFQFKNCGSCTLILKLEYRMEILACFFVFQEIGEQLRSTQTLVKGWRFAISHKEK